MTREEFGSWAEKLTDRQFWEATAVLGIIGRVSEKPPKDRAAVEEALGRAQLPGINTSPSNQSSELQWMIGERYVTAARNNQIVAAEILAAKWDEMLAKGLMFNRFRSLILFSNQYEVTQAFRQHLNAAFYYGLRLVSRAADFHWPVRVALPRGEHYNELRTRVRDWSLRSSTVSKLVRFPTAEGQDASEFLVLSGMPSEALRELESFPKTIRAHCLLLFAGGKVDFTSEEAGAMFTLQKRALTKAVLLFSLLDSDLAPSLITLFYELAHNIPLDQVLRNSSQARMPVACFDPTFLQTAMIGNFAEKVARALDEAQNMPITIDHEVARAIYLPAGPHPSAQVAQSLRNALAQPDAFDRESKGSTWSVQMVKSAASQGVLRQALDSTKVRRDEQPGRRLQLNVTRDGEPVEDLHLGHEYEIDLWIGLREGAFSGVTFPEQSLPWEAEGHLLTITFFAPGFTPKPVVETLYLPRTGNSSQCSFFFNTGRELKRRFQGRLTIAHLNRVLQTYLLVGNILWHPWDEHDPLSLTPELATQCDWQGLDSQLDYGANVVINEMDGERQAVAQCGYQALAFSLDGLAKAMDLMETKIDESKWEDAAFQGLNASGSRKLVLYLAKHGFDLLDAVKRHAPSDDVGQAFLNNLLAADPVQILAAKLDARLPIEFFYANPYPVDNAVLCPTYQQNPGRPTCADCPNQDKDHYCPLGFWSLRKVIEWHDFEEVKRRLHEFAPREYALQARDERWRRDQLGYIHKVLVGISEKAGVVEPERITELLADIRKAGFDPVVVKDWNEWTTEVAKGDFALLLLIPHTLKNEFDEECMEISGMTVTSGMIDATYVKSDKHLGPIVLLLGCNTDNLGVPFRNFALKFMNGGSAIVVSTIAHMLGRHAAPLAANLVSEIAAAQNSSFSTFGQMMLNIRRKWLRGQQPPISLALKSYGDARWRF
jgi:hypothetical protein